MIEYDEKNQKYIVRKALCSDRKHDYDFIESFVIALRANGFSGFQVIVPVNSNANDRRISIEDFFGLKKYYYSQIILGENPNTGDSIKALLVDIKSKSSFDDNDYSNGYGCSEVLVRSSNPVRAYYLVRQLQLFTEREGKKRFFSRGWVSFLPFAFFLFSFFIFLKNGKAGFSIVLSKPVNSVLNILLWVICIVFVIASIADTMKELSIANNDKNSFKQWLFRLNKGEYKDYLVSRIAFFVFGTVFGVVINNLLSN